MAAGLIQALEGGQLVFMAGPCMLESQDMGLDVGRALAQACTQLGVYYVFKSSFDKANRSTAHSPRGPGLEKGLQQLAHIKDMLGVPILTDIHTPEQAAAVAPVADILQIPAFLCHHRTLIQAAGRTGKVVQIKKGQSVSAPSLVPSVAAARDAGSPLAIVCERGSSFGYNNLVVDFKGLLWLQSQGYPVCFDATHAVQLPGAGKGVSSGQRQYAAPLAAGAVAMGIANVFAEVHPNPPQALSDKDTQLTIAEGVALVQRLARVHSAV